MSEEIERRSFLSRMWKWGFALVALAGAWTSWDILQPASPSGFGGKIKNGDASTISSTSVETVAEAQAYVTKNGDEVVALWWRCPHLGCRVPWCESAGEFECPCHGSTFNRLGEYRSGTLAERNGPICYRDCGHSCGHRYGQYHQWRSPWAREHR